MRIFRVSERRYLLQLEHGEEPIPPVHARLCRPDGTALGGHVRRLVVGATLEIDIEVMPGAVRSRFDPRVGLHRLDAYGGPDDS
jgi:predicted DNA-binding protein with PD1-like motif